MFPITLVANDYLIDEQGHHVLDDRGFAQLVEEETVVEIESEEDYDRILAIIEDNRVIRGLNPDGSEPEEEE